MRQSGSFKRRFRWPAGRVLPALLIAMGLAMTSCANLAPSPTAAPTATTASVTPRPNASLTPTRTSSPTPMPPTVTASPPLSPLPAGHAVSIGHVWMESVDQGWAIGGAAEDSADHVLRTDDGGGTWRDVTPPEPRPEEGQEKVAVGAFIDADNGWVIYAYRQFHIFPSAVVWATRDGGQSWAASAPLPVGQMFEFFSPSNLEFIDPLHGWVMVHAGAGMMHDYMSLYRTIDGGQTWEEVVEAGGDQIQICPKTGMAFADPDHGWITRDCGGVIDGASLEVTSDGGRTWDSLDLSVPTAEPDLFDPGVSACAVGSPWLFSPGQGALAVRCVSGPLAADVHSYVYRTSDSGATWQAFRYPGGELLFFDPETALALSRTIAVTHDAGMSWTTVKTVHWDGQFSFLDGSMGWAVARDQGQLALVKTADGGRSWQEIHPIIGPQPVN